jgi:hypothetical protein
MDDNLLDVMRELRAKCEALCRVPMAERGPIRDRIIDLTAAYLKIMVPAPRLTELKRRRWPTTTPNWQATSSASWTITSSGRA